MPDIDPVLLRHRSLEEIAMVALRAGRLLMESGAPGRIVHDCVVKVASGLGAEEVHLRSGYASLAITVGSGTNTISRMLGVGPHGVNHRLDHCLRHFADEVASGRLGPAETLAEIERLARETPRHPPWLVAISVGLACAAFARLLDVDWAAFTPVLVASTLGQALRHQLLRRQANVFVVAAAIAFFSSLLCGIGAHLAGSATVGAAMVASILLLVPGVPILNAQTDIMEGRPTLGSARAVTVVMILVFAAVGLWSSLVLLGVRV